MVDNQQLIASDFINNYLHWVKENTNSVKVSENLFEISTP